MSTSDEDEIAGGMFDEPEGFRQPEKACAHESYQLKDGRTLSLRLVGSNPLWVGLRVVWVCKYDTLHSEDWTVYRYRVQHRLTSKQPTQRMAMMIYGRR